MIERRSFRSMGVVAALGVTSVVAILFGFFLPDKTRMAAYFQQFGFPFLFAAFACWLMGWPFGLPTFEQGRKWGRRHGFAALIALGIVICSFLTSPPRFRILADETNLLGVSLSMYYSHSIQNPTEMLTFFDGFREPCVHQWDKRSLFFPFLLYLAHCALGFRPENAFLVNGLAGFGAMLLMYVLLNRWFSRTVSLAGMACLGCFPLVVLWTTSGGFEIPNMGFAILAFLLLDDFLIRREAPRAEWLAFTLLLLAQIRYESAIFVIVLLPIVLAHLPRAEWRRLSWRITLLPLLFLPVAWQRLSMFGDDKFQIESGLPPFSHIWLSKNLGHAWRFFSGAQPSYGMIPILWWLALGGMIIALVKVVRLGHRLWVARRTPSPSSGSDGTSHVVAVPDRSWATLMLVLAAVGSVVLQGVVLFLYFWGNLTLQYAMRLGIIFLPFQIVLVVVLLDSLVKYSPFLRKAVLILPLLLFAWHWNVPGQNAAVLEIFFYREFRTVTSWMAEHGSRRDDIIFTDLPNFYVPLQFSSIAIGTFNVNPEAWKNRCRRHLFQRLVVVQKIRYSDGVPTPSTALKGEHKLRTLFETQFNSDEFIRISQILHEESATP